jgi:hypothetical protein
VKALEMQRAGHAGAQRENGAFIAELRIRPTQYRNIDSLRKERILAAEPVFA